MNSRIKQLAEQATTVIEATEHSGEGWIFNKEKFAKLIIAECDRLNRTQSLELAGVVADVEQGNGFDSVCLDTVKLVESYLADSTLKKHFGVEL